MATPATVNPFNFYPGRDGLPLQNGYLYFGEPFQDPELQPLQAYWDDANTQPAARPIRTINGYPARNGAPAQVFVGAQYSMRVRDSQGREVFYAPNVTAVDLGGGGLDIITASGGQTVVTLTNAVYTPGSNAIDIALNGIIQISGQDYFETGTDRITMASALSAGDQIRAFARSTFGLTQAVLSDWQAEVFNGAGGASQNFVLTRNPGAVANLDVSVTTAGVGSTLRPLIDYTLSGNTVTITPAPAVGTNNVLIRYGRSLPQDALRGELASTASAADGDALVGVKKTLSGAVARTQHAVNEERVSILDFGAVGDGALTTDAGRPIGAGTGTNNSSFIQAANDAIVAGGKPMILEIPPGIFRCDTGLKINAGFVTLEFRGGALDFRNIGNAKGLQVYSTRQYLNSSRWCIGSGAIYGPVATVSTTSVGLFYESNSGGVGSADIAEVSCNGLNVYHFAESIQVGNNAYMVDHVACNFWFSNRFFYCPSGLTNTGQRWAFPSCQFLNGVNGFYINEATINLELDHAVVVPTGGYAFGLESGYVIMNGGGIEVDSSTGAQLIKNTNAGGGAKSTFIATGANFLYKNTTTQPFVELNSTNTYVTLQGGHASVAAGSVFMTGTGSGNVCLVGVLPDGALDPNSSNTLGAGFGYQVLAQPLTGISVMNKSLTANGLFSNVTPGGSVAALSGSAVNQVSINGTFTTLFTSAGAFLIIVRDNTAGGMAVLCYDAGSGVIQTLANNIAATVAFQHTGTALQARTTAGTVTRTMIILAIKV